MINNLKNLYIKGCLKLKVGIKNLITEQKGATEVIAILLIIIVLIAIIIVFKEQLSGLIGRLINKFDKKYDEEIGYLYTLINGVLS